MHFIEERVRRLARRWTCCATLRLLTSTTRERPLSQRASLRRRSICKRAARAAGSNDARNHAAAGNSPVVLPLALACARAALLSALLLLARFGVWYLAQNAPEQLRGGADGCCSTRSGRAGGSWRAAKRAGNNIVRNGGGGQ
jgi:hypothetical protein